MKYNESFVTFGLPRRAIVFALSVVGAAVFAIAAVRGGAGGGGWWDVAIEYASKYALKGRRYIGV